MTAFNQAGGELSSEGALMLEADSFDNRSGGLVSADGNLTVSAREDRQPCGRNRQPGPGDTGRRRCSWTTEAARPSAIAGLSPRRATGTQPGRRGTR
ncbi:hypothetical protein ACPA9J_27730 [Pseudomonas aeruginosa]